MCSNLLGFNRFVKHIPSVNQEIVMLRSARQSGLFSVLILIVLALGCSDSPSQDKVIEIDDTDSEMAAAIDKGRATLPQFWHRFGLHADGEKDFFLKVKITDDNGTEYFWVGDLKRDDRKIYGTINNEPEIVKSVKLGERIYIPEEDIFDWLYMCNGKMVGNFTLRALFKHMSAEEVEAAKNMLAEPEE